MKFILLLLITIGGMIGCAYNPPSSPSVVVDINEQIRHIRANVYPENPTKGPFSSPKILEVWLTTEATITPIAGVTYRLSSSEGCIIEGNHRVLNVRVPSAVVTGFLIWHDDTCEILIEHLLREVPSGIRITVVIPKNGVFYLRP